MKTTKDLIINLKVIGKIGTGFKINTKEKYIELDDSTWYQWALRKYRGDTRYSSITKINDTVEQVKFLIRIALEEVESERIHDRYMGRTPRDFLEFIRGVLEETVKGLKNLMNTYTRDTTIYSQLEMNLFVLEKNMADIDRVFPELFNF